MFRNLRIRKAASPVVAKPTVSHSKSVLAANAAVKGTLTSEGDVRIDGTFDGDITAGGSVAIGEAAKVEGNTKGQAVAVAGMVRGDIEAKRISVLRTGRVWGDLNTNSLTTEEGGFIQGVITMREERAEDEAVKALPPELEAQVAAVVEKKAKK